MNPDDLNLSRRSFLKTGGAAIAGSALIYPPGFRRKKEEPNLVQRHRLLGRTGFEVSDISMGAAPVSDGNVIRLSYDRGVNYFDTAEGYGNGASERAIGEAMPHMDRAKIFITTKLLLEPEEGEDSIRERFAVCLERMKTDYADALFVHDAQDISLVAHAGYHAAVKSLKAEGRLKYAGISSHGPRGRGNSSMDAVLLAAAEDGRFDLMLFSCNFLNTEESDRVVEACKEHSIGTTAMKTVPGYLDVQPWDEENPFQPYLDYIERVGEQGVAREVAIERIKFWIASQQGIQKRMTPFAEKHGIDSQERLHDASIQWVLNNPDMHTICVSMPDFDSVQRFIGLSGTELSLGDASFLEEMRYAIGDRYCRHGCRECLAACPGEVPVSTIMRYSYYFAWQRREKYAMGKYAGLGDRNVTRCAACDAPCLAACPHGVQVPANLLQAHALLSLA